MVGSLCLITLALRWLSIHPAICLILGNLAYRYFASSASWRLGSNELQYFLLDLSSVVNRKVY